MAERPTIECERLRLRPFALSDAPEVMRLAGDDEIAANVPTINHPYELYHAETWIGGHQEAFDDAGSVELAIELRAGAVLVGAVGLRVDQANRRGEIGYWVGRPYWGHGYATEAARGVLRYALDELGLHRVQAHHFTRNPASGAVLRKLGMRPEGVQRGWIKHRGRFEDIAWWGLLRTDPEAVGEAVRAREP